MNTFSLKVIASDKVFFDGKCGIIIVPALDGEQAIMSHHEDMVIATREGEVRFKEKEEDDWTKAVVGVYPLFRYLRKRHLSVRRKKRAIYSLHRY